MIGKLIITGIIVGGFFFLFSESFDEIINTYANAASTDIENLKNNTGVNDKINEVFEIIYEKFVNLKLSLNDFF